MEMKMQFLDVNELKKSYQEGQNIIQILNKKLASIDNSIDAIEMSYDLQAGSYIESFQKNQSYLEQYTEEQSYFFKKYFSQAKTVIDAGCGELTNTALLFSKLNKIEDFFAFDLSWSRLFVGREFYACHTSEYLKQQTKIFCSDMACFPFSDNSIDVVVTSHSLEPNHGREKAYISELLRVSRMGLLLFEPSFELGDSKQKERMKLHGYVRNLPGIIEECGGELIETGLTENYSNPLNRTAAFVVRKKMQSDSNHSQFVDPIAKTSLITKNGYYFSPTRGVSYPIIEDIPILRSKYQILTTGLNT